MEIAQCCRVIAQIAVNPTSVIQCLGIYLTTLVGFIVTDYIEYQTVGLMGNIRLIPHLDRHKVIVMPVTP
ncbi:MAG: hypothetical protein K2O30_07980 [Duncaniella sp.]|nr:hypothetical protein [Duncaniella sp.]MDE7146069.1 hypothetical protein [Duncaniella sp.]